MELRQPLEAVTNIESLNLWNQMIRTIRLVAPLVAGFLSLGPTTLAAQEALTLDRAVQDALAHNALLRAARASAAEGAARITEARAEWFPRISVTETWQRGNQPVFVFSSVLASRQFAAGHFAIDALNYPDALGFFRASVGVDQVLFDGGRRRSAVDSAEIRHEIAQLGLDEAAAGLVLATTQTYGRILVAEAGRGAADAAVRAAREDLVRAEHRRDTGVGTDADVLALVAHVADLQQRAIQHQGDAIVARAELNRLMGTPIGRDYQVAQPSGSAGATLAKTSVDALLAEADGARPELRRAAAMERLAATDLKSTRTVLVPQVAAQATFDMSGTGFNERASAWLIGGEVRWNLSLGGAELARVKAASEARSRAAAEADDVRTAVHLEVVTALRRLEAADARQTAGRAAVDQARASQRIVRDRFEAGLAGVTDVLRASSALMDAEAQRIAAIVDSTTTEAMLRRAVGRRP